MKRFDDEFDWHADQKRGALARMVDRLLEVLRRSFLDPFAYRERDNCLRQQVCRLVHGGWAEAGPMRRRQNTELPGTWPAEIR
jgi:hypothetical protein